MAVFKNISGALLILEGPNFYRVPELEADEEIDTTGQYDGDAYFNKYVTDGLLELVSGVPAAHTAKVPQGQKLVT